MANLLNTVASNVGQTLGSAISSMNPLAAIGSAVGSLGQMATNAMQMNFNRKEAEKQRQWSEAMQDKQNQWSLDMWNKTNEYNSPTAQLARLKEAGLNPLYYGLDGSSANGLESAQALGYERAQVGNLNNPFGDVASTYMAGKSLAKDIEMKNAQIDKLKADTASVGLDNEWKDKTMEARVESEKLANELTKEQKAKIVDERRQIEENIKKTIAETDNEIEKKLLINAQTRVANAQADEIAALLPYRQMLMQAQTDAQKAAAAASWLNCAINQKLLDEGQVDAIIDKAKADAKDANARAAYDQFRASVHNGTLFDPSEYKSLAGRYGAQAFNSLFAAVSNISEVLIGPISGILK